MERVYKVLASLTIPAEEKTLVEGYLARCTLHKVEVSPGQNICRIFLQAEVLPDQIWYKHLVAACQNMLHGMKVQVIPILKTAVAITDLQVDQLGMLQHIIEIMRPIMKGWFRDSVWVIVDDEIHIRLTSQIGQAYLEKHRINRLVTMLIKDIFGCRVKTLCSYDKNLAVTKIQSATPSNRSETPSSKISTLKKPADQVSSGPILLGHAVKGGCRSIADILEAEKNIIIEGVAFSIELKTLKNGKGMLIFGITDKTDSLQCKVFERNEPLDQVYEKMKKHKHIRIKGSVEIDRFTQELTMATRDIMLIDVPYRFDSAPEKRVELHLHTQMSNMDGISSLGELVKMAADYGHPAIAVTDHGVVQSFPDAYDLGKKYGIQIIYGIEAYMFDDTIPENLKPKTYHVILLAKNMAGLHTLYKLVTESHLRYFKRRPRIPKRLIQAFRDDLVIGSACEAGELIQHHLAHPDDHAGLLTLGAFYDYIEVQPHLNNEFLWRKGMVDSEEDLIHINKRLIALGEKLNKPVVATGDVHFATREDALYRRILMSGKGFSDADLQPPLYYRTTREMLDEFPYLDEETARKIVIENPKKIIAEFEEIKPVPDELHSPFIEGAEEEIIRLTMTTAKSLYGEEIPELLQARIDKELNAIISNGFAVLYLIAHKLVKQSNDDGYLVGSRGSVGSSLVAFLTGITEVNAMSPHYRCAMCQYSEFIIDGSVGSGFDLPDKMCPHCDQFLVKDGHDIPFEVFLGFKGDKVPDIDLNFSGDYQSEAHKFTEELFGKDNVFRAGTIATVAEKTAFGYVKKYYEEKSVFKKQMEINRLALACTGVKRTTGQHPGGLMVIPLGTDVHQFTPLQRPADDVRTEIITTHFDYHSISERLVKLDILGHDDPTVIKMLEDLTGTDARKVALDDPATMSLFSSTTAIGLTPKELGSTVATFGIPEFGTKFVRQMLEDTKPKTFSELVRISGFSHGTDVWLNNAQDLIRTGTAKLSEAISARDDIMVYLIHKNLDASQAFKIMEGVRKGRGVTDEDSQTMREHQVPEWYIESCKKIKYMFPKAHAVAYVTMAFRIAWYKINEPLAFYASFFTVRGADEFQADVITSGIYSVQKNIAELYEKGNQMTTKEAKQLIVLEVALEFFLRGFHMLPVDIQKSHPRRFLLQGNTLLPPLIGIAGLGGTMAENIALARTEGPFISIDDLCNRGKVGRAMVETMAAQGILADLPESNQIALF